MLAPARKTTEGTSPDHLAPSTVSTLLRLRQALLIDVREPLEYRMEHIPGSMLLPLSYLEAQHFPQVFAGVAVVLVCESGKRSWAAGRQLLLGGVDCRFCNLEGGIEAWKAAGLPVQGAKHDEEDYAI
jgi:rhodanese-related sulfurtransferase